MKRFGSKAAAAAVIGLGLLSSAASHAQGKKGEGAGAGESTNGLDMQAARGRMMSVRGQKVAYTKKFDLSGLPEYKPREQVKGTLHVWGSNYITDGRIGGLWEAAFQKYHPDVKFDWHMKTTLAAVPSLIFGVSDLGIGRQITFSEEEMYERFKDRAPLEIDIATGSFDVPGWNPGFGVVVNKDNPLTKITMEQLDGIFGAQRDGGWQGTSWHPEWARGPEKNIRTWGQLGLTGEWADKPIDTYGLNLRYHQSMELSDWLLKGSDKWNETTHFYANYVTKDGKLMRNMNADLAADRYGISVLAAPTTSLNGEGKAVGTKILPLARTAAGPYIPYTLETLQDRTYPLYDRIFAYLDSDEKNGANPLTLEFLRFVVSREGQELIQQDAKYLPLTAAVSRDDLKKLDAAYKR